MAGGKKSKREVAIARAKAAVPANVHHSLIPPDKLYKAYTMTTLKGMKPSNRNRANVDARYCAHLDVLGLPRQKLRLHDESYDTFWHNSVRVAFKLKVQDAMRAGQAVPKRRRTKRRLHADGKPYDVNEKA
ncbi:MAG: hypothetical protein M1835_005666 [Candelina submexicana]|nr:MAG: hypothetical protein M1835_005666 [Candelina submexicana]